MAIGTVSGQVISTKELELGQVVTVDHERYQVVDFLPVHEGTAVVLAPAYGPDWQLEVHENDIDEPMWETA